MEKKEEGKEKKKKKKKTTNKTKKKNIKLWSRPSDWKRLYSWTIFIANLMGIA